MNYNLQVLPDLLTSSAVLFAILFQSVPMATFGGSLVILGFLHGIIARFFSSVFPNTVSPGSFADMCSGRFPGVSYERLLGIRQNLNALSNEAVPSYYTLFVGFLTGWIGSLPTIYGRELNASPQRKASVTGGLIALGVLLLIVMGYRILSSCEGILTTSVGLLVGFVLGLIGVFVISYLTERRATNILGLPLIRDTAVDGKPIYVCERKEGFTSDNKTMRTDGAVYNSESFQNGNMHAPNSDVYQVDTREGIYAGLENFQGSSKREKKNPQMFDMQRMSADAMLQKRNTPFRDDIRHVDSRGSAYAARY